MRRGHSRCNDEDSNGAHNEACNDIYNVRLKARAKAATFMQAMAAELTLDRNLAKAVLLSCEIYVCVLCSMNERPSQVPSAFLYKVT